MEKQTEQKLIQLLEAKNSKTLVEQPDWSYSWDCFIYFSATGLAHRAVLTLGGLYLVDLKDGCNIEKSKNRALCLTRFTTKRQTSVEKAHLGNPWMVSTNTKQTSLNLLIEKSLFFRECNQSSDLYHENWKRGNTGPLSDSQDENEACQISEERHG